MDLADKQWHEFDKPDFDCDKPYFHLVQVDKLKKMFALKVKTERDKLKISLAAYVHAFDQWNDRKSHDFEWAWGNIFEDDGENSNSTIKETNHFFRICLN